jgi:threonine dehydrogenase-like Zn-dependent dehydrogenase
MRASDVLGHEFMGEVIEVGSAVQKHHVGDRVVVCSFIACGQCWYCQHQLYSLCDNGNPNPALTETLWGSSIGGCFAYSHALGGFAGSHAEYIRVPTPTRARSRSPTGCPTSPPFSPPTPLPPAGPEPTCAGITPGDTVAVWGAGGVGQMAALAAMLLGAEQVVVIDRIPERLQQVRTHIGAETLDYTADSVVPELKERTGGRGPDVCIEAVGMEAHGTGPQYLYDQLKQQLRLQSDRPTALREAIYACREGGSLFALGVFGGLVDKFPFGAIMNKGMTVRGAQQHGHRYIPMILERIAAGEISTEHLATHILPLDEGPHGYTMFKNKVDGCVRAVIQPGS